MASDFVTLYPGRAITWIRREVRTTTDSLVADLDGPARAAAAAWLNDLVAAGCAVRELRSGSYAYYLQSASGGWAWLAYRIVEQPSLSVAHDPRLVPLALN
ncbi:hypothetical protein MUU72_29690 [Streptomyces sp. RS10V-4]|uniref:hypothetical protein n=1 Tax=Streptomyces rhizoryzae TaxID=2932493 RepID=UPI0020055937|nr:hypothetical protein [Streptomyces rhizoryzae]MCK7627219.1 hypothetical protein [Streptomyces rhizoryzae]